MGSTMTGLLGSLLIFAACVTAFVLVVVFVAVPLMRGVGTGIGALFHGVGWIVAHIFEFVAGIIGDVVRFVGSIITSIVLLPLVPVNIVIGRWSASGHFAKALKRECQVAAACVYRLAIRRPLKFVLLHGLLEGIEERVPEAMHGAPKGDRPSRRTGQFDGYTIVGSLRAGGSGARLYIAQPEKGKQQKLAGQPDRVVIKSFALTEGSSLPQIVRESRALECAKQLGHVLEHGMDEHRFYYVMPYHPGDHLGILTRQMHAECGPNGLDQKRVHHVMGYVGDLVSTLSAYHRGGLWHKDVKPENVIVHDGHAHLVDLGLVTPLRSAMTLTTHGTEYFRDPEMVKQALRGVKVHQVDGAKFDIFAAGAVLYFMLENTFPAHGGLSRFVTRSPESLRWIVRRAMTDYNSRYESADVMLADLEYVARSRDAFAVRPADLPSMRGRSVPPVEEEMEHEPEVVVAAASTPRPPADRERASMWGVYAGKGVGVHVGRVELDENGDPVPKSPRSGRRPKLSVTNWWTGEYRRESQSVYAAAESGDARTFRKEATAFRSEADEWARKARAGAVSARRAAREQVKAARRRAADIRRRALTHRKHTTRPAPSGSPAAAVIGLLITGIVVAGVFAMMKAYKEGTRVVYTSSEPGRPVILVVENPEAVSGPVADRIQRIVNKKRESGFDVIVHDNLGDPVLSPLVTAWRSNTTGEADRALEDELERRNLYGVLHVRVVDRDGTADVRDSLIRSTRSGATSRRTPPALPAAPPDKPYLLVNDHPAKMDPRVQARIEQLLASYTNSGWTVEINDDVEVAVRKVLPVGPIDGRVELPAPLHAVLAESNLGGVLRIDAMPGDAPAHERVAVTRIDAGEYATADTTVDDVTVRTDDSSSDSQKTSG